ncbi:PepSY domain-containing protein [Bacillus sp. JCM 19041]|uniref:PepSY domain-containing protein n=1 Tax=Bacillus sp. JCM 19041 TaxID=1460637 RepID=UPI0006CF2CBC
MKKWQLSIAATVAALALAGCNQGEEEPAPTTEPDMNEEQEPNTEADNNQNQINMNGFQVDLETAIAEFEQAYPGASITAIDFDSDLSTWRYEIEGVDDETEYELYVDAETGDVSNEREEALDAEDAGGTELEKEALDLEGLLNPQEAIDIALAETEGIVDGWKLDRENDTTYYEVTIETDNEDFEVKIDASSGDVIETEQD